MTTETLTTAPARNTAWNTLGTALPAGLTAADALSHAGLAGWNVRKTAMDFTVNGVTQTVPDQFAIIRDLPEDGIGYLGTAGNWWTAIQNEDHIDVLNTLADESGAEFTAAGKLGIGQKVFVTMTLPDSLLVGGEDRVDMNIAAFSGHDGKTAFNLAVTPTRIACANQQSAVMKSAVSKYVVRHTKNHADALQQAREALGLTNRWMAEFQTEADRMIEQTITDGKFAEIVNGVLGKVPAEGDAAKAVRERSQATHDQLMDLYVASPTNTSIRGTRWAAYQAFTEFADFYSPIRARSGKDELRAVKVITGGLDEVKGRAFELCRA